MGNAAKVFSENWDAREGKSKEKEIEPDRNELLTKVGQLTLEVDWLKKNLLKCLDLTTRKGLISVNTMLSVKRQSNLLDVNRTSVYYVLIEKSLAYENQIKERLDYWHTKMPYLGVRKLKIKLALKLSNDQVGIEVGRKLIKRCMAEMGIYAMYPKPNLSKRNLKHKIHPYLLRNLAIEQPNQVWAIDITYIKMGRNHLYLTAIIDWYSRFIVGWALSQSLDTAPVLEAVSSAIKRHGRPEIINSDQGCQFTSAEYIDVLKTNQIRQSMDGKARWIDNVIIERWFRSLKVEYVYINELETQRKIRIGIAGYIDEYNYERPHQSHGYKVPFEIFNNGQKRILLKAA